MLDNPIGDKLPYFDPALDELTPLTSWPDDAGNYIIVRYNKSYYKFILGVMQRLCYSDAWEGTEGEKLLATQKAWRLIEMLGTPYSECSCMEMRANGQWLEYRCLETGEWVPLLEVLNGTDGVDGTNGQNGADGTNGQDGAPGADGLPGQDGAPGECLACDSLEPDPPTGLPNAQCSVAWGVNNWAIDKFNTALQYLQTYATLGESIVDAAAGLLEVVPVIGEIVSKVVDFVTDVATWDIVNIINVTLDPDWVDHVRCHLYCALDVNGNFTEEALQTWQSELLADPPYGPALTLVSQLYAVFLGTIRLNDFRRRANVFVNDNNDNCECDCNQVTWRATFDFAEAACGWLAEQDIGCFASGTYVNESWWLHEDIIADGYHRRSVSITLDFGLTNITKFEATYDLTKGTYYTGANAYALFLDGVAIASEDNEEAAQGVDVVATKTGDYTEVTSASVCVIACNNPSVYNGLVHVKKVVLEGYGIPPTQIAENASLFEYL